MGIAVVVILLAGSAWFYTRGSAFQQQSATATPSYYTTAVRQGNIRVAATGAGELTAAAQANLSFATSGTVGELNVKVGDIVTQGQVLAKLKDLDTLKANLSSAELAVLQAQASLSTLQENAALNLATAYKTWLDAQTTYADALYSDQRTSNTRCSKETTANLVVKYERSAAQLAKSYYESDEWIHLKSAYDTAYANMVYCTAYTADEKTSAQASLQVAETQMKQAEATYNTLQANQGVDPTQLAEAQNTLSDAQNNLSLAQKNLDSAVMVAPMDGTVISIAAGVGEQSGTSSYITIADLSNPNVTVRVDETDLGKLKIGNQAEVVFDALPDRTFSGEVIQVDPALSQSGQTQVATGIVRLDPVSDLAQNLPLGLNASVDVIDSEANGVLLVPQEAVRDLGDNQYAVFVLENNQLSLKMVEIGLTDGTYTEIRSGLSQGELVSTGITQIR
jgi:HlyD family secretion protein